MKNLNDYTLNDVVKAYTDKRPGQCPDLRINDSYAPGTQVRVGLAWVINNWNTAVDCFSGQYDIVQNQIKSALGLPENYLGQNWDPKNLILDDIVEEEKTGDEQDESYKRLKWETIFDVSRKEVQNFPNEKYLKRKMEIINDMVRGGFLQS